MSTTSPLEKSATSRFSSDAPTESVSKTLPGEPEEPSPELPAEATTTVPARSALRTGSTNSPKKPVAPRLMLMASAPLSTAHCIAPTIWAKVPEPLGSASPWSRSTSGATPMCWPLASPPETVPLTCEPWKSVSWGCEPSTCDPSPANSAQPPGNVGSEGSSVNRLRSGWVMSIPVSMTATFAPAPRVPKASHASGASIWSSPNVVSPWLLAPTDASGSGSENSWFGWTRRTPGWAARRSRSTTPVSTRTTRALTSQRRFCTANPSVRST